jgi:hypothetical protein
MPTLSTLLFCVQAQKPRHGLLLSKHITMSLRELGKEAADDVDVYTILLKLGLIRASNWGERWSHVKNTLGIVSSSAPYGTRPQPPVPSPSTGSYSPPTIPLRLQKTEEDTFTLHSRVSGSSLSVPPRPKPESEPRGPRASTYARRPTTRDQIPSRRPRSLLALANPKPPKVSHPPSQISDETAPNSTAFTAAKPPSYRTHAHESDVPISSILPVLVFRPEATARPSSSTQVPGTSSHNHYKSRSCLRARTSQS